VAFEIEFAESVEEHLEFVTTAERSRVLDAIDRQLKDSPLIETRNRKPFEAQSRRPSDCGTGDPTMKKVSVERASRSLGEYAAELQNEIVVVTKGRRAVAALVPLNNVDRESLALSTHPEFLDLIKRARAEVAAGKTLSLDEMRRRVLPRTATNKRLQPTARKRRGG
jgi:antitoxin (DNA-binding transcriptional repressor) of toxin-antitoxin stability system